MIPFPTRPMLLAAAAASALALFTTPIRATTWHVPSPCPTIQAGIDSAAVGDTVLIACGTYYEHDIVMKSGITLRGETGLPGCAILDGQQQGPIVRCESLSAETLLEGLQVTNGAPSTGPVDGAVLIQGGSPVFSRCEFTDNRSVEWDPPAAGGGGVYAETSSASFLDCAFASNVAWFGAAVHALDSDAVFLRCEFLGNSAYKGAGVYLDGGSGEFTNCTFRYNEPHPFTPDIHGDGPGIYSEGAAPLVRHCIFEDNSAGYGAGAIAAVEGALILEDCVISACMGWDGSVVVFNTPDVVIRRTTITGTMGSTGGAFSGLYGASGLLQECLIYDNVADTWGGAAFRFINQGPWIVDRCTLSDNSTTSGAAIKITSIGKNGTPLNIQITKSIVAFTSGGPAVLATDSTATLDLIDCCDIYGNSGGDWVGCLAGQAGINGNFSDDPLFCDAASGDFTLGGDSPCMPANNSCGQVIGAEGYGCGDPTTAREVLVESSWGRVKERYR